MTVLKVTQPWNTLTDHYNNKIIKQARTTGRLNLSNQRLKAIPEALFTRDDITSKLSAVSFENSKSNEFNWWEEVDITKLIIADNEIQEIDPRLSELGALTSIDVGERSIYLVVLRIHKCL